MMKKYNYFSALCFAAAMAFTACTQDELADGGDTLPEGKYPLQIASVTMEGESSAQPWGAKEAQTRVSENEDGTGSVWDGKEKIGVQITNDTETAIYTLETDKSHSPRTNRSIGRIRMPARYEPGILPMEMWI